MSVYYISGPMRGKKDFNRQQFNEVETALDTRLNGNASKDEHEIVNPSSNFAGRVDLEPGEYMALDLKQVLEADVIVQLPGWQDSEGANREAQLAVWANKRFIRADIAEYGTPDGRWIFTEIDAPEFSQSPRASVLDEAKQLITGDRNNAYGPPTQDFKRTAAMASAFGFSVNGGPMQSHHVAIFMEFIKISHLAWTPTKRDSWVDTVGYAGCGYECAITEEQERLTQMRDYLAVSEQFSQPQKDAIMETAKKELGKPYVPMHEVSKEEIDAAYAAIGGDHE
jgi:hypothetical protein